MAAARREIKWSLPVGLKVAVKPASLDVSLIGAKIFMRWDLEGAARLADRPHHGEVHSSYAAALRQVQLTHQMV